MKNRNTFSTVIILILVAVAYLFGDRLGLTNSSAVEQTQTGSESRDPPATSSQDNSLVMQDVKVYDLEGNLAYEGDIDLAPVFDRIELGERDSHDNDGSVFSNREGRLPQKPRGYYHEYVVRTPGMRSVGPQRLILGENGEAYYTSDHYESFTQVR